jgi:hypothetical protein
MTWFTWLQLAWTSVVVVVLAERARAVFLRMPVGQGGLAWVTARLSAGDADGALAWAAERPDSLVGQLLDRYYVPTSGSDAPDPGVIMAELSERASARLTWLRVAATLSSTLGLLGAVIAIARGLGPARGLVALESGLAERMAMDQALTSMALGVGTAALCFYGLSRLRPAARQLIAQTRGLSHLLPGARRRAADGSI